MRQLTLRGIDPALEDRIREAARERAISLSRAALLLLRRGAGLDAAAEESGVIGHSLDAYFGCWSEQEAAEFERAVAVFDAAGPETST